MHCKARVRLDASPPSNSITETLPLTSYRATVMWTLPDGIPPSNVQGSTSPVLTVTLVELDTVTYSGQYTCTATQDDSSGTESATLTVRRK